MPEQLPVGDSVDLDDLSELSLSIEEVLNSQLVKPAVIIKAAEGACQNVLRLNGPDSRRERVHWGNPEVAEVINVKQVVVYLNQRPVIKQTVVMNLQLRDVLHSLAESEWIVIIHHDCHLHPPRLSYCLLQRWKFNLKAVVAGAYDLTLMCLWMFEDYTGVPLQVWSFYRYNRRHLLI